MPVTLKSDDRFTGTVPVKIGVTETLTAVLCDKFPEAPEIVTVTVAGAAERSAVSVMTLDPVVLAGAKAAVTPCGSPDAVRLTALSKLPLGMMRILLVAVLPCDTEAVGSAEIVKSGAPAFGEGSTSYSGCTGFTSGFSSATETARMRIFSLFGSFRVLAPAGRSNP